MAEEVWKIIYTEEYKVPPPPPAGAGAAGTAGAGYVGGRPIPPPAWWGTGTPHPPPSPTGRKQVPDPVMEGIFKIFSALGLGNIASFMRSWTSMFRGTRGAGIGPYIPSAAEMAGMAGGFFRTKPRPRGVGSAEEAAGFEGGLGGGGMFGGSFEDMAAAYRETGWRVGRTAPPRGGGGGGGAGEAIRNLNNTNQSQLKEALKIGALFTGIAGSITFMVSLLKRSKIFSTFMDSFLTILGAIIDIMLIPLIPFFGAVLKGMGEAIPTFIEFSQTMGNAIGVLLSGTWLNEITGPLIGLLEFIPKIFAEIVEFFASPIDWFVKVFTEVFKMTLGGAADIGVAIVQEIWNGVVSMWNEILEWGGRILVGIWNGFEIAWDQILEWGGKILGGMWAGILVAWNQILEWGGKILGGMWSGIEVAFDTIVTWGEKIIGWIGEGVTAAMSTVIEWGGKILGWIGDGLTAAMSTIVEYGGKILTWIGDGITTAAATIGEYGGKIIGWIGVAIDAGVDTVKSMGSSVIQWFIDGIEAAKNSFTNSANSFINYFIDIWNSTFGLIPGIPDIKRLPTKVGAEGTQETVEQIGADIDQLTYSMQEYLRQQSLRPESGGGGSDIDYQEATEAANATNGLLETIGEIGAAGPNALQGGITALGSLFSSVPGWVTGAFNELAEGETQLINQTGSTLDGVIRNIGGVAGIVFEGIAGDLITKVGAAAQQEIAEIGSTTEYWKTQVEANALATAQQEAANAAIAAGYGLDYTTTFVNPTPGGIPGAAYTPTFAPGYFATVPFNPSILASMGYQAGSPFIPRDMMAFIHRGEAVIPEALNRIFAPFGGAINVLKDMISGGGIERRTAMQPANVTQAGQNRHLSIHNTFNITRTPDRELPTQLVESMEEQLVNAWQRIF